MEKFTEDYMKALKEVDLEAMVALVDSLETDADKEAGLAAVIEAIRADKSVIADADKILEELEGIKGKNEEASEPSPDVKIEAAGTVGTAPAEA